jgi:hypothetical protein
LKTIVVSNRKGGSGKTTPSSALIAVVKEFKLHSLMRSQQREEFERQHMAMEEKYEDLVKKKETEIIEAGDAFKQAHASFK